MFPFGDITFNTTVIASRDLSYKVSLVHPHVPVNILESKVINMIWVYFKNISSIFQSWLFVEKHCSDVISTGNLKKLTPTPAGPLLTKRTDVLAQDLVKSRSHEIKCYNDRITIRFDRHLDGVATEVPGKFQSDQKRLNTNLTASRLHEIVLVARHPSA